MAKFIFMDLLYWKHNGFNGRNITIGLGGYTIGKLRFIEQWNGLATYTSEQTKITFKEKGLFNSTTKILYNGEAVGEIRTKFTGHPHLHFINGPELQLKSKLFGRSFKWVGSNEKAMVHFVGATMASFAKGEITANDELTLMEREVLISAGLFTQQLIINRVLRASLIIVPVFLLLR